MLINNLEHVVTVPTKDNPDRTIVDQFYDAVTNFDEKEKAASGYATKVLRETVVRDHKRKKR